MKLQSNPFYILHVPCSAGRREIVSAADEMSFVLDSETCANAQNALIHLPKRITAEIGWFFDVDADVIASIRACIDEKSPISTDALSSLSRLNATLYNFTLSDESDPYALGYAILEIDEQYTGLNIDEITQRLNLNRSAAKLATVQSQDVSAELGKKRDEIRQIITEKLSSMDQDSYIELITMLAEKCIADEDYEDGVVLSDVVDQYEVRMQSAMEERAEGIETQIERIKHLENDSAMDDQLNALIRSVQEWDSLAQPLQLKSQASGMPHEISEQLGADLRGLALYLHNEKGKTKEALTLVDAMKDVFAELGTLSDQFESDSDVLNDLLQGEKETQEVLSELESLRSQAESIKVFATVSGVERFVERVKKLDARLTTMDLDPETCTKIRKTLCYMARSTAIELHNTKHRTNYALTIVKALLNEFGDMPSLRPKLNEDFLSLSRQMLLLNGTSTGSYRSRSSSSEPKKYGWIVGIIAAVVLMVLLVNTASNSQSSSGKTTASYNPTASEQSNNASTATGYTVTLDKSRGVGGTASVTVKKGDDMPSAKAPTRSGYIFQGYYASANGSGTKYYDANMKSTHVWDKDSGGTLYAKWEKKGETKFTPSVSDGDTVYVDIVSIFPELGIYTMGSSTYSHFVCKCRTSAGGIVWVYMSCSEYLRNFDATASTDIFTSYAEEVTFTSSKRIRGKAKSAETVVEGLSADTGAMLIDFSSVS